MADLSPLDGLLSEVALVRFCPRCNEATFWDGYGARELECMNTREGEPAHCGFTLATPLSGVEQERFDAYARRLDPPRPLSRYEFV